MGSGFLRRHVVAEGWMFVLRFAQTTLIAALYHISSQVIDTIQYQRFHFDQTAFPEAVSHPRFQLHFSVPNAPDPPPI